VTAELATLASRGGRLAIDTEFMSEGRYRALLCLAQVAVPDSGADGGVRTEVLDPLVDALDPRPVAAALADPAVEVTVHAGRQDIAILRRTWRTEVTKVFDTQVAAGFVGFGPQERYESLVRSVLGVKLGGSEGFTRWDRRPLTEAQLSYARADAARLLELGGVLQERLAEAGRLEWAREECRPLERSSDERDPERIFQRLPRVGGLRSEQRAVGWALVQWRERTARELDRPIGTVLPDQALIELARRRPSSREELEHIRGLPKPTLHRRHRELLEAIRRGKGVEAPALPDERFRPRPADAPLVSLAAALVRQRSLESGVATDLIATQLELGRLVAAVRADEPEPELPVLAGWRRELVGGEILELLAGRRALGVNREGLRVDPS
jgi:ribonuclease D